ncbi:MAG: hypothetical protein KDD44_11810, partial [Bdellovibrionales bacterium]|nr:hypothetical protein [Bdellovibrionales bacterium]
VTLTQEGYAVCCMPDEVALLSGPGKGVIVQRPGKGDRVRVAASVAKKGTFTVQLKGGPREVEVAGMTITGRAKRGLKVIKRGAPVVGSVPDIVTESE